jgi:hypothetical protein
VQNSGAGAATPQPAGAKSASEAGGGGVLALGVSGVGGSAGMRSVGGAGSAGLPQTAAGASGAELGGRGGAPASAGAGTPAAVGGSGGVAGVAAMPGKPGQGHDCGSPQLGNSAFGCKFAWGTNDDGAALSTLTGLQFITKWVGYEAKKDGSLSSCDGCSWLREQVASTPLIPVYYAYFIGFFGKANGLPDGNENPNGPNLTTDAAKLIRTQRAGLIEMYRSYAQQSAAAWPTKPLVWLLEGDFVQYAGESQKERLSYVELAELAQDITCAIKSAMPNAVVAINHSTWNADQVTNDFWQALSGVNYDLVWTTGVANNMGFMEAAANTSSYNHATATYAYVHKLTGRDLFVDTSFGLSEMADSWSGADATALNARIAEGVVAANVSKLAPNSLTKIVAVSPQLNAVCR